MLPQNCLIKGIYIISSSQSTELKIMAKYYNKICLKYPISNWNIVTMFMSFRWKEFWTAIVNFNINISYRYVPKSFFNARRLCRIRVKVSLNLLQAFILLYPSHSIICKTSSELEMFFTTANLTICFSFFLCYLIRHFNHYLYSN